MSDDDEVEGTWGLVLPFVACQSQGGQYDDLSFAAGYDLGALDRQMQIGDATTIMCSLRGPSFRQLDLMAMNRGWILTMTCGPGVEPDDEEWLPIELVKAEK